MGEPGVIRKLDDIVINRIAAGEVIQRPCNALKEMIENSLDAKATAIQVTVHGGGMKFLQIQDNGTGVRFSDLSILCERFTTSKLRKFEDLTTIATYGFRGEALASISHVAHLSVVTKTVDAQCAFRASYVDGKMIGAPKPCAGNQGTKIVVEDLFYNIPTRRSGLKSVSEEFSKIADVISRYAIHNHKVGFTLKKQGETTNEICTPIGSTAAANIQVLYGSTISKELLDVSFEDSELKFKLTGQITNPNYEAKRLEFILFINGRLVECTALKKMIEAVYTVYLTNHACPFVYLSLEIPPKMLDVNVHPTKEMVEFLHEDVILQRVREVVNNRLTECQSARTFAIQNIVSTSSTTVNKSTSENRPSEIIRTDSAEQKLDKFFSVAKAPASRAIVTPSSSAPNRRVISLSSVLELRKQIEDNCHSALRELFKEHSFVGCILQDKLAFIQHGTKLYMCDIQLICKEFFYQLFLYDFGNFGAFRFTTPISLEEAALAGINSQEAGWEEGHGPKEELAKIISGYLVQKSRMLADYFSLEIDETGKLHTLPLVLDRYIPSMVGLPMLIVRMATEVNWDSEQECFETLCKELTRFYATPQLHALEKEMERESGSLTEESASVDQAESSGDAQESSYRWLMENIVFSALKSSFQPLKSMADNGTILEIANLHKLYQIFERC